MSLMVKRMVEEYGYGSTEEFMEAIEQGVTQGQMSQDQINQMKIAMLQVLKDAKQVGPGSDKQLVDSTKLGVLHTLKDTGLLDKLNNEGKDNIEVDNLVKLYKDASPEIRREIETKLGLTPATDEPISPSQATSAKQLHEIVQGNKTHALETEKVKSGNNLAQAQLLENQRQADQSNELSKQQSQQQSNSEV
jgi:hypothetical protein